MQTRKPIVAGQFYPGQHDSCLEQISECLEHEVSPELLPETIAAGIVPHAGWTFSGELAAMVFSAIREREEKVHTFVIFGAAHSYSGPGPAVFDSGCWNTPLGSIAIDEDLAGEVLKRISIANDVVAHATEHSIEVQVPFIQHLFGGAKILPIIVPPSEEAIALGEAVGEIISSQEDKNIVCIGSTDLTHYGPRYGFIPKGAGADGVKWAHEVNDKAFIDLALKLEAEQLLANSAENYNACGAGAAAAAIAAAKKLGKSEGVLLAQTNSNEIMLNKMGSSSTDSVGYAAIVF
ncbi:MAG: AmmeMemoRadiSam system protein B [Planctomycetes bacterium]|nr:AmmeMemoRadiSam system protein B [Planctomycetota bacterium]